MTSAPRDDAPASLPRTGAAHPVADGPGAFDVYDTTLRDGAQQEGMNLSVADKLAIAPLLDELGVGYIEGGWPGAIPKDTEFFARAAKELDLRHAVLAAFGATRKPGVRAWDDPQLRALLDSEDDIEVIGEAGTAESAIARIPALKPDVAVLDVRLPDGNGIELCRDLLSRMPDL